MTEESKARMKVVSKRYYVRNSVKILERHRERYRTEPDFRARLKRDRQQALVITREKSLGVTPERFSRMLVDQGNVCEICNTAFSKTPRVDHDHITGFVRGLLCNACNLGLGAFKDSESSLLAAVDYLRRSNFNQETL